MTTIFDDLETDLNATAATPARKINPNGFVNTRKEGEFVENCPDCRGSGSFYSYTGRYVGPCFKCKGKGKITFRTSPETRQRNAEAAAHRNEKAAADRAAKIEEFNREHAAVAAWIAEASPTFEFAAAMGDALAKYGSLTANQLAACERCIEKRNTARAERAAREASAPEITVAKIEQAFASAKAAGLKWPRLDLGAFRFKPAGEHSKNAGAIYVTEAGDYLGKITGGRFVCVKTCGDDRQARVLAAAADPEAAAVAHGKATGSCSCCGRDLSNPESIARGIGPICAEKFGW